MNFSHPAVRGLGFPTVPRLASSHFAKNWRAIALAAGLCAALTGCGRNGGAPETGEFAYVSGASAELRDELGPGSKVIGHFQSGERIEVLSRRPRWAEVRRPNGQAGWVLQRVLVSQDVFDQFAKLAREAEVIPSQGRAVTRRDANLHREPGRTTQTFYQLGEGEQVDVVRHRVAPRGAPAAPSPPDAPTPGDELDAPAKDSEDWLLVRGTRGRAGWLLETAADPNLPIEIAQYSEGLRIRAWFEIYREQDGGKPHPWYLWATVRNLAGVPYDFDEIRVFVWDPKSSRYETSYRERNLTGYYPIVVGSRQTPDGDSPTFHFGVKNSSGERVDRKYFMLGRQVRLER
jgi:hypothetical protein